MKVCVIGAGPSGLCAAKEIIENNPGFEVTIFEKSASIGGTFARSYAGLTLVNNPLLISFSDFLARECIDDLRMWTSGEYVDYLGRYAKHHQLLGCIRYRSSVISAHFANAQWQVTVSEEEGVRVRFFDHLVVCSGANGQPNLPRLRNQKNFAGRIVHSGDIRDPSELKGLNVVFIGLGETASDLCHLSSSVVRHSVVSIRTRPGYLIPRYHDGRPTDLDTSKVHHSLPKILDSSFLAFAMRLKRRIEKGRICSAEDRAIQDEADSLNARFAGADRLGPFRRISTKSCGFIRAQLAGAVDIKPEIVWLDGNDVHFSDGTAALADIIVCCTGYRQRFDFLPADLSRRIPSSNVLYDYMLWPEYGTRLAFIGFVRPGVGTVPVLSEMQGRYLGLLFNGRVSLPQPEEMAESIRSQQALARALFPQDFERVSHLVDYYPYLSGLARKIGVQPRQWRLFLSDIALWYKVNFSFLCPGMFRLHGPGARPAAVKPILRALPTMHASVLLMEGALYALCRLLSLVGFRRFRPSA